jgi:hypothetical protein
MLRQVVLVRIDCSPLRIPQRIGAIALVQIQFANVPALQVQKHCFQAPSFDSRNAIQNVGSTPYRYFSRLDAFPSHRPAGGVSHSSRAAQAFSRNAFMSSAVTELAACSIVFARATKSSRNLHRCSWWRRSRSSYDRARQPVPEHSAGNPSRAAPSSGTFDRQSIGQLVLASQSGNSPDPAFTLRLQK